MTYTVKLPQFEGPFDLLLFFIERDELDIYDIPIFKLTNDFLAFINDSELLNIELASDFMLVAATLMRIKAKMLLPRKEVDEAGELIDPREELVRKLLEYKQYKAVVAQLVALSDERALRHERGNVEEEGKEIAAAFRIEAELEQLSLYKLLRVFEKVVERQANRKQKMQFSVIKYPYTIKEERSTLKKLFKKNDQNRLAFQHIFEGCHNRIQAIYRFLALLEMVQGNLLQLRVGLGVNNFWIEELN